MLLLEAVTMMRGSRNMAIVNVFVRGVAPVPVEGEPSVEARGAAHPMRRTARARIDWGFMAGSLGYGWLHARAREFPTASVRTTPGSPPGGARECPGPPPAGRCPSAARRWIRAGRCPAPRCAAALLA